MIKDIIIKIPVEILNEAIVFKKEIDGIDEIYFHINSFEKILIWFETQNMQISLLKVWQYYLGEFSLVGVWNGKPENKSNLSINQYFLNINKNDNENIYLTFEV